jgi:maltose/moltooligosaccharide transporter
MLFRKPRLSFWQIINMNVGFFGIQYSFGLQQSAVNPIYDFLGAKPDEIPILNLAGPVTGLILQPIIGALSDKTWHPRWGRRKPFFLIGALLCSVALFIYPFSSSLWMAAGLLWILDAGNNTAMEPYRAFIADKLDTSQQGTGFQSQSFFTGLGQTLANVSLFIFPMIFIGKTGSLPAWIYPSFFLGAVCSIGSIWWSIYTTPEIPPTEEELKHIQETPLNILSPFTDVFRAIRYMPKVMWLLALVYLFQWYALFCYWQNSSKSIAQSSFGWKVPTEEQENLSKDFDTFQKQLKLDASHYHINTDSLFKSEATNSSIYLTTKNIASENHISFSQDDLKKLDEIQINNNKYEKAVSWTGLVNGWYNVITFLSAFVLVWFAKKYSPKAVHITCLLMAGVGFLIFPHIENKYLFFPAITGFGVGWASMMGIPYLMVVNEIPKERYGVYMGIINMMIVIPMIIQNLTFGFILKNFLNNDPRNAISFAGIFLLIAATATLLIKSDKAIPEDVTMPAGGH